jgi:hypothetical protein
VCNGAAKLFVAKKGTPALAIAVSTYDHVEFKFVDQSLEGAHISGAERGDKKLWMLTALLQPLLLMRAKFLWQELATTRMLVVITVNLSVTLEADWNCVRNVIRTAIGCRNNMISFDLDAAEAMAYTATPMNSDEQLRDVITVESQS